MAVRLDLRAVSINFRREHLLLMIPEEQLN